MYALFVVLERKLGPVAGWLRNAAVDYRAVELHEAHGAIVEHVYFHPTFMDFSVMEAAETHEVRRLRFAALGPVLYVVSIDVSRVRAAGKATALVASFQKAT